MNSRILGKLKQETINSIDLVSLQPIATPFFENKKINYRFAFKENRTLTLEAADIALENFFTVNSDLKNLVTEKSFANWTEYNEIVGALDCIKVFQSQENRPKWMEDSLQNSLWLAELTNKEKVWEYITPTEILVIKDRWKKREGVYIQILCDCGWEEEHSLQIILKNGNELTRVSQQDGNLFE